MSEAVSKALVRQRPPLSLVGTARDGIRLVRAATVMSPHWLSGTRAFTRVGLSQELATCRFHAWLVGMALTGTMLVEAFLGTGQLCPHWRPVMTASTWVDSSLRQGACPLAVLLDGTVRTGTLWPKVGVGQ